MVIHPIPEPMWHKKADLYENYIYFSNDYVYFTRMYVVVCVLMVLSKQNGLKIECSGGGKVPIGWTRIWTELS